MFISFFSTKSDSQMSETPSILKVLLMTSSYLLSFLTHILSVKLKIPHTTPPHPHALIRLDGMLTKIRSNIYLYMPSIIWTSSPLFKGAVNFNSYPGKRGWKYQCSGRSFWMGLALYLIFSRFIIFKFRNYFILCKIVSWYATIIVS